MEAYFVGDIYLNVQVGLLFSFVSMIYFEKCCVLLLPSSSIQRFYTSRNDNYGNLDIRIHMLIP